MKRTEPSYQRVYQTLSRLRYLIEPHAAIVSPVERQRSRIMSAVALVCLTINLISFFLQPVFLPGFNASILIVTGAFLCWIIVVYGLTRTPYTRFAPILNSIAATLGLAAFYLHTRYQEPPGTFLSYMPMITLTATFTMSMRASILTAFGTTATVLCLALFADSPYNMLPMIFFNIGSNILILGIANIRLRDARQLAHSEQRVRSLMEANLEVIVFFNQQGHILDVNKAFQQILGYEATEVINQPVLNLIAMQSREAIKQRWQTGASGSFRVVAYHKSGSPLFMEVQIIARNYGDQPAFVIIGRDITRQIELERRTREREQSYQALFNSTTDAVFTMDLNGVYLNSNQEAGKMLRCTPDAIRGQQIQSFMLDNEQGMIWSHMKRVIKDEQVPVYTRHFRRPDGTVFPAEVSVMLVKDTDGRPMYIQSLVRDITARQRTEQQKIQIALQNNRMGLLREFMSDASHNFRTPLANIKNGVYLLGRLKDKPEKHDQQLAMMESQMNRMEKLIDDLLTMIRLEEEQETFRRDKIPVNVLIQRVMEKVRAHRWDETHHWSILPCPDDSEITGDSSQLIRAFLNMIQNAIHATPEEGQISLKAYRYGEHVVMELHDTGVGISTDDLPNIFNNFYQTAQTMPQHHISNGMGLPISQKIINLHGGHIEVESEAGVGTCFRVMLPIAHDTRPFSTFFTEDTENYMPAVTGDIPLAFS